MSSLYKKIQKNIQKRLKRENQELYFIRVRNTNNYVHCVGTNIETDEKVYEILPGHIPATIWNKTNAYNLIDLQDNVDLEIVPVSTMKLEQGSISEVCYVRKRGTNLFAHYASTDTKGEHNYNFLEGIGGARIWNIDNAKTLLEKVDVNCQLELVSIERAIKDSETNASK